ncbi:MAG: glycosyltransferase family 2 protein [Actinomycetota bacterium]
MRGPTYSIVIPVLDEEETLETLFDRLSTVLQDLDGDAEVLLVDDGSRDRSYEIMLERRARDPRFKLLRLSRNFGHQIAITAGLDAAAGDAVVIMDSDLQDPPEIIPELAARWRDGYEIVHAVRTDRDGDTAFKRATASVFYRALRRVADLDAPVDSGDFRLVDRRALEAFRSMRENNRYVRGLFAWVGFNQSGVTYLRGARAAGVTKYPFRRMLKFAADAVLSFSNAPLRMALTLGFILAVVSFLGGITIVVMKLSGTTLVPGWTSILTAVCFIGGIQLVMLGVVGEYIARIYDEVKNRPLYIVSDMHGIAHSARTEPRRSVITHNGDEAAAFEEISVTKAR